MSDLIERVQAFTDSTRERWSGSEMSMATALLEEVVDELTSLECGWNKELTTVVLLEETCTDLQEQVALMEVSNIQRDEYITDLETQVALLEKELFLARTECDLCGRALRQEVE